MLEWWNGIHASLKNWWGHTRVGSTPTSSIENILEEVIASSAFGPARYLRYYLVILFNTVF